MLQPTTDKVYQSIHYNLKQICPRLLEHKESYLKYQPELYVFNEGNHVLRDISNTAIYHPDNSNVTIRDNLTVFSSYLAYNILMSYLRESYIVLKDMEDYFVAQMMSFLRGINYLKEFPMKTVMSYWGNIERTVQYLKKRVESYERFYPCYTVHYTDGEHNFKDIIPLVGVNKDDSISIMYILLTKDFIMNTYLDIIRVPSICKTLLFFFENKFDIKDVSILWLPGGETFKPSKYMVSKYTEIGELREFIYARYKLDRFTVYTSNLTRCSVCPFWEACKEKDNFLNLRTVIR